MISFQSNIYPQSKTYHLPKQFISTETSREENFLHSINRRNFLSRLTFFENTNFPINSEGIDSAKELSTNILNDICASYFRLSCPKNKISIPDTDPFFFFNVGLYQKEEIPILEKTKDEVEIQ